MSQFDTIVGEVVTGIGNITGIEKIYTSLCDLNDGQPFPRCEIFHGDEILAPIDDEVGQVWDSKFIIIVNLYAKPSEIDALLNLLRKYVVDTYILYINDSAARWNIEKGMTVSRNELPEADQIIWFQVKFMVHSRFLSTDL
jgi:hypothetical protein